jgi:AbrB family looped-hinge helix DNA binding protein
MAKSAAQREEAVRVGAKFQVTIPRRISKALRLKKGDHMLVRLIARRVELVPASLIPRDQLWFWTPEWQQKEREADVDINGGKVLTFDSVDELLRELKS